MCTGDLKVDTRKRTKATVLVANTPLHIGANASRMLVTFGIDSQLGGNDRIAATWNGVLVGAGTPSSGQVTLTVQNNGVIVFEDLVILWTVDLGANAYVIETILDGIQWG